MACAEAGTGSGRSGIETNTILFFWSAAVRTGRFPVRKRTTAILILGSLVLGSVAAYAQDDMSVEDIGRLSIEDLGKIESLLGVQVGRAAERRAGGDLCDQPRRHHPLRRHELPEMLRLAPNLEVAQISATSYVITARGFNGNTRQASPTSCWC